MIFTTYSTEYVGGMPRQVVAQTIEVETSAIIFTDYAGIYTFDTKQYSVTTYKPDYAGNKYQTTTQAVALNAMQRQRAKDYFENLVNLGVIDLSQSGLIELGAIIDSLPIFLTGSVGGLQVGKIGTYPDKIDFEPSASCAVGVGGMPQGRQLADLWNNNGSLRAYSWGNMSFNQTAYWELPCMINLIGRAIDEDLIQPSDELADWVGKNMVAIPTDKSFHWDVYINAYKSNPLKGGYETQSIIVRWTCPAVNMATEEYIESNPDYPYQADNTLIELRADKTKAQGFSSEPFLKIRYGEMQTKLPMSKLSSVIGTSEFMKQVSEFIPASSAGDCYLYLGFIFENLAVSDYCIAQIPLNLTTQDVSHLYTMDGRHGSTVTIHFGEPTEGISPDVVGWNDDLRIELPDDDFITDPDDIDVTSDIGTNSNIGVLTTSYAMTETNLKNLGHKLWDASFLDDISLINNSPIENIISVKSFGFPFSSGTSATVKIGNVSMNVEGLKIPSNFSPIRTIGTFKIDKKFSGHLEWLNYQMNARIYLPYVGFQELDIFAVLNKTVTVKYIYDIITGVCTACLYADSIEIAKYSGNMAIDIPITASNRAQVEAGYLTSALGALASLATGNLLGTVGSAFGAIMNQNHFTTKGSPSPSCDSFDEQKVFVIIDKPVYYEPSNFAHDYGYPCNMGKKLKHLKGFTKCRNVDVNAIICTEDERAEIKRLLESGVYL